MLFRCWVPKKSDRNRFWQHFTQHLCQVAVLYAGFVYIQATGKLAVSHFRRNQGRKHYQQSEYHSPFRAPGIPFVDQ